MTRIANPIYDIVFKYLMSDNKAAKLMLSAIIGKEVVTLQFKDRERSLDIETSVKHHRIDFSAEVIDEDGEKQVIIIELQQIRLHSDILRFRRYLGEQYMSKDNSYIVEEKKTEYPERKAMPILSIYFLGYKLFKNKEVPVVKISREVIDNTTGEIIHEKNDFVECLTHESFIIQIPYLKERRRNEVEVLLSIFDQTQKIENDEHCINIKEEDFPEKYRPIIRRLLQAASNPDVRRIMDNEDDIVETRDFQKIAMEKKELLLQKQDEQLEQKNEQLEQKEEMIEQQKREIEELKRKLSR